MGLTQIDWICKIFLRKSAISARGTFISRRAPGVWQYALKISRTTCRCRYVLIVLSARFVRHLRCRIIEEIHASAGYAVVYQRLSMVKHFGGFCERCCAALMISGGGRRFRRWQTASTSVVQSPTLSVDSLRSKYLTRRGAALCPQSKCRGANKGKAAVSQCR